MTLKTFFSYLCRPNTMLNMQNRFIKNIIFLLFLNLLVKPFWILGIDREVQNLLGDASYGTYQALFNFSYLFYILLDLGITNFNSRAVAQDPKNLSKHFGGLTEIKLLLGLLYAVVVFVVGYCCGYNEGLKLKLLFEPNPAFVYLISQVEHTRSLVVQTRQHPLGLRSCFGHCHHVPCAMERLVPKREIQRHLVPASPNNSLHLYACFRFDHRIAPY